MHLKVNASKCSDLADILFYSDHEEFYTLREFLLDCEYGLLDLGSNIHFLLKNDAPRSSKVPAGTDYLICYFIRFYFFALFPKHIKEPNVFTVHCKHFEIHQHEKNVLECTFTTKAV